MLFHKITKIDYCLRHFCASDFSPSIRMEQLVCHMDGFPRNLILYDTLKIYV
jgi:hypothetical protein